MQRLLMMRSVGQFFSRFIYGGAGRPISAGIIDNVRPMFRHRTVGSALNREGVEGTKMKGTIMRSVASFFLACLFVPLVAASGSATEITLTPIVQGSGNDCCPQDGTFDVIVPPPNDRQLFNNVFQQSRAAFEFDISAIPSGSQINSAVLQICIGIGQIPALPPPSHASYSCMVTQATAYWNSLIMRRTT